MTDHPPSPTRHVAPESSRKGRETTPVDHRCLQAACNRLQAEAESLRTQLVRIMEENRDLRASAFLWIDLYERQLARANTLASGAMRRGSRSGSPGNTVLLVQADRDTREMYVECLRREGFQPIVTGDGRDALRVADRVDAIVTGVMLTGGVDGLEIVERLKRDERTRDIPVIVLTTCSWPDERARAERAGCALFLAKPCLPDQLIDGLRRVLAESAGRAG